MSAEGIFHNAHEVYLNANATREWIATFANKGYAEGYVKLVTYQAESFGVFLEAGDGYEVVPI